MRATLVGVTLLNAAMAAVTLLHPSAVAAPADDGILRGRGLQIVDDQGRVRASIQLLPSSQQADGTMSAETVLLRLMTEKGRPSVKIATSEQETGMSLAGPTGTGSTYVQATAGGATSAVGVRNEDGRELRIAP